MSRLSLAAIVLVALLVPFGLRPIASAVTAGMARSYLPALETFRERVPYDPTFREDIRKIKPEVLFIGDSMLGSRIDPTHMTRTIHRQTWWVMQPGTGPAWWYLAFKNQVLGAGARPKVLFVFFRDDNLTDVMFRLDPAFRWSIDTVAGPEEPELNAVVARRQAGGWARVHDAVDALYQVAPVRARGAEWLSGWPVRRVAGERRAAALEKGINGLFAFDKLRPMVAADMAAGPTRIPLADQVDRSILPEFLRLAREHGVRFVAVRVKRRPGPDGRTAQTPEMARYARDLGAYLEANGAAFIDETGDAAQTLDWYKDGDHLLGSRRREYTEHFARRAAALVE